MQASAQSVELPHNQNIALTQCLEASLQTGSVILLARRQIRVNLFVFDAGCGQGIPLQVKGLAAVSFRNMR